MSQSAHCTAAQSNSAAKAAPARRAGMLAESRVFGLVAVLRMLKSKGVDPL